MDGISLSVCLKYILLQISLIDRVHKIYNDTVWQDRSVSITLHFARLSCHMAFILLSLCLWLPKYFRIKKDLKAWDLS